MLFDVVWQIDVATWVQAEELSAHELFISFFTTTYSTK